MLCRAEKIPGVEMELARFGPGVIDVE